MKAIRRQLTLRPSIVARRARTAKRLNSWLFPAIRARVGL